MSLASEQVISIDFALVFIRLERLTLVIPWKNIKAHPTKVLIDGLYMLVVPKNGMYLWLERDEPHQEALPSVLEVRQDLTEYYEDKMQRVQRKLNNLRKLASSESTLHSLLFQ